MLYDFKFQIMLLIVLVLFLLSSYQSSFTFQRLSEGFNKERSASTQQNVQVNNRLINLLSEGSILYYLQPNSTYLLSDDREFPYALVSNITSFNPYSYNRQSVNTPLYILNWLFIVSVIGSLFSLLISYDLIANEKQKGTLRLNLIAGVSRLQFFLSKYISAVLVVLLLLLPSALLSVVYYSYMIHVFSVELVVNCLIFFLLSIPYLSFFILCGLAISLSRNHNNMIIKTMLLWAVFIMIIPQASIIIAKTVKHIKTASEYEKEMIEKWEEEYNLFNQKNKKYSQLSSDNEMNEYRFNALTRNHCENTISELKREQERDYLAQKEFAIMIAKVSPYCLFDQMTDILLNIGYYRFSKANRLFLQNYEIIKKNIINEDNKDMESKHLFYRDVLYDDLQVGGKHFFSYKPFSHPEKLVMIHPQAEKLSQKLQAILLPLCLLLFYNLFLFGVISRRLSHFDVR